MNQGKVRRNFHDRLLTELKRTIVEGEAAVGGSTSTKAGEGMAARSRWRRRVKVAAGLAAALTVAVVAFIPSIGSRSGNDRAYAVIENGDGTVTVEIASIEDSDGLDGQLEGAGVPAVVHYLPPGKLCNARGVSESASDPTMDERWALATRHHDAIVIAEADGEAFSFTVDKRKLIPEESVVIYMQYSAPEYGQQADRVASIHVEILVGASEECDLVDGSIQGWGFQEGAVTQPTKP